MGLGARFPRGAWATSPLRLFASDLIQAQEASGDWIAGTLRVIGAGIEITYEEPRSVAGCLESSRLLGREETLSLRALLRPESLWNDEIRERREAQVWNAAHPSWKSRVITWLRELVARDPHSQEPLLRHHIARRVVVESNPEGRTSITTGLLIAFDATFLALADASLPAETALPLCPGRTTGADLEIEWNDDGLRLFNRGAMPVAVLGLRTSEGLRPWEFTLRPGTSRRTALSRAPAGTTELVFESQVRGDVILPREHYRVRGASEGTFKMTALPDPETRIGDLPKVANDVEETQLSLLAEEKI